MNGIVMNGIVRLADGPEFLKPLDDKKVEMLVRDTQRRLHKGSNNDGTKK